MSFERGRFVVFWAAVICVLLLLTVLVAPIAQAANVSTVTAVTVKEAGDVITITLRLTRKTGFDVSTSSEPSRLSIRLKDSAFDLPVGAGRNLKGTVSAFKYGAFDDEEPQVVFDTSTPLTVESSLMSTRGEVATLSIKLTRLTKKVSINRAAARVVVIDPGHGGIDPGAIAQDGKLEKDIVFSFAKVLKEQLERRDGYKVVLSRTEDKFVSLPKRVEFARANRADLMIALHADSVSSKKGQGITFYTLSDKASDAESAALATRENLSDAIGGVEIADDNAEVADVLMELLQRESRNHALFFAQTAVDFLKPVTPLTGKPIRAAHFAVLKAPDVPSLLVELGFMSSENDSRQLASRSWQTKTADAMADAIDHYFAQEIPVNSISRAVQTAD